MQTCRGLAWAASSSSGSIIYNNKCIMIKAAHSDHLSCMWGHLEVSARTVNGHSAGAWPLCSGRYCPQTSLDVITRVFPSSTHTYVKCGYISWRPVAVSDYFSPALMKMMWHLCFSCSTIFALSWAAALCTLSIIDSFITEKPTLNNFRTRG